MASSTDHGFLGRGFKSHIHHNKLFQTFPMSNLKNTLPGIPRKWNGLDVLTDPPFFLFLVFLVFFFAHFYFPASGRAVVTGVIPFPPRFSPSIFIARIARSNPTARRFHRVLLTHALALSASQFVLKKKSQRIYTSIHSAGLELMKLTNTRLEDNLIRHRGDHVRPTWYPAVSGGESVTRLSLGELLVNLLQVV